MWQWLQARFGRHASSPASALEDTFQAAVVAHQSGEMEAAESGYLATLKVAPAHPNALLNLATLCAQTERLDAAGTYFERALATETPSGDLYRNYGNYLRLRGHLDAACTAYERSLQIESDAAGSWTAYSGLLSQMGRNDDAVNALQQIVLLKPDDPNGYFQKGLLLGGLGRGTEAIASYRHALRVAEGHLASLLNLGRELQQVHQFDEAEKCILAALELFPEHPVALSNYGALKSDLGEFEDAKRLTSQAVELEPGNLTAKANLGGCLLALAEFDEANAVLTEVLAAAPSHAVARMNMGMLDLVRGRFDTCWDYLEERLNGPRVDVLKRPYPRWRGDNFAGKTLLLVAEQGVGDEIMFASCIADLLRTATPARCILECDERLIPLFARSFPDLILPPGPRADDVSRVLPFVPIDAYVPLGSLPLYLRRSSDAFPRASAFLEVDELLAQNWRERLRVLGVRKKVGISWRGGHDQVTVAQRSTTLQRWASLLATPDVTFINLQYGDTDADIAAFADAQDVPVHSWPELDPLVDMDGFAALVSELDLVISIDNSTVHVSGAVGTPTWVLLPHKADSRWPHDGDDARWYQCLRFVRQDQAGDWDTVFERLCRELNAWLTDSKP
jgi:tetratricopeptide (TPR) repeat protein